MGSKVVTFDLFRYRVVFGVGSLAAYLTHYANIVQGGMILAFHFGRLGIALMASRHAKGKRGWE